MQALIHSNTVVQIEANKAATFPVHPDMQWVTAPASVEIGWVYNGVIVAAPVIAIAEAQADAIRMLEMHYQMAVHQQVAYKGHGFQADNASQSTLSRVLAVGSVPSGFFWLDAINNTVPMTFSDLQGLASVMLAQGQAAFIRLQTKKTVVNSATTTAAVQGVVW